MSSKELSRFLATAVAELAAGGEVILLSGESEVSPAEAGELLGISRQFIDRLIDVGKLPARRLPGSRHRRIRVADVVAFGKLRDERRVRVADAVNALVDGGAALREPRTREQVLDRLAAAGVPRFAARVIERG